MTHPIEVDALTRRFGDFTAVSEVSFTIEAGEIFGFLGPNGAGKTTTIKMLTGLLAPTTGRAKVAGHPIGGRNRALRQTIGYMSQKFSLYEDLRVDENVELFAGLYGVTGDRFAERRGWVLSMAGLEGRERRLTRDLPLGWKQRLALGCAVIHEPPVLFLDEPTSGVDPMARRRFWDLIDELAESGTTILVSTHYMEEAEYCHRLALMNRGRLIALDSPAALRQSMSDPILQVRSDDPAHLMTVLSDRPEIVEAGMFGRSLRVVLRSEADQPSVEETLRRQGAYVRSVDRVPPSLEDVFVARVRESGGARVG